MSNRILSLCFAAILLMLPYTSASSEYNTLQAKLVSYDYSRDINFGSEYQTNINMQLDEGKEKSEWIKLWLRIHIITPTKSEWAYPQQYSQCITVQDLNVFSTQSNDVYYTHELMPATNAMPINCTPNTIDDLYDDWEDYWTKLFPDWSTSSRYAYSTYWSDMLERGETEWILEILMKDVGQTEIDIHNFVNSLSIECVIDISYCESIAKKVSVKIDDAKLERRFDESSVQFFADSFYEEDFRDLNEKVTFFSDPSNMLLCSNDANANDFRTNPEQFSMIGLNVTMFKQMPWAICDVEVSVEPTDRVIGIFVETTDAIYDKDRWKNGFFALSPIFLVVKADDIEEQTLKEELKSVVLYFSFSTEFVGENDFSRIGGDGYHGIRFQMQVNMNDLMTLPEINEKIGNISDG